MAGKRHRAPKGGSEAARTCRKKEYAWIAYWQVLTGPPRV